MVPLTLDDLPGARRTFRVCPPGRRRRLGGLVALATLLCGRPLGAAAVARRRKGARLPQQGLLLALATGARQDCAAAAAAPASYRTQVCIGASHSDIDEACDAWSHLCRCQTPLPDCARLLYMRLLNAFDIAHLPPDCRP